MAKIEAFPAALLLSREEEGEIRAPGTRLSLASHFAEPDLRTWHREGYGEGMTRESDRVLLPDLRAQATLHEPHGRVFILAIAEGSPGRSIALYCRYPAKAVKELFTEVCAEVPDPDPEYLTLLRNNGAVLDPLHLALNGYYDDDLTPLLDFGEEISEQVISDGVRVTYREIRDSKEIKVLHKLFDPGLFSRGEAMILDGPVALCKWQAHSRREHLYAALIPISKSFGDLSVGELIWDRRESSIDLQTAEDLESDESVKPLPKSLSLPAGMRLLRHYYSSESSREYAKVDFLEDLRLEAKVSDVSALLVRDRDEFGIAVGPQVKQPAAISQLYTSDGFLPKAERVLVDGSAHARTIFASEFGYAATWMPLEERYFDPPGKEPEPRIDFAQRLFNRRPPIEARRAMLRLRTPIPFTSVVHMGL